MRKYHPLGWLTQNVVRIASRFGSSGWPVPRNSSIHSSRSMFRLVCMGWLRLNWRQRMLVSFLDVSLEPRHALGKRTRAFPVIIASRGEPLVDVPLGCLPLHAEVS